MKNKETEKAPLVTVLVPSYNHSKYVKQCIESIVGQTYKNIELIVIDDGSTDDSVEVIKQLQKIHGFTFFSQKNIGLTRTLNKAIQEYVSGVYLCLCASDDYYESTKVEKMVSFLESNQNMPVCYCRSTFVDENNDVVRSATGTANRFLKGGEIFGQIINQKLHFLPGMVRFDVYNELGLYSEEIWTEDFEFNLKVSAKYPIGFVDEYLNFYRFPSDFSKKLLTTRVPMAHKACIDVYRHSRFYKSAILEWNYRNFIWFSGNSAEKIFALKSMLNAAAVAYRPLYWKAILNLVFNWIAK